MCGIAGLATAHGVRRDDEALVVEMLHGIGHRGPDDEHWMGDERAIIGSRRLAIIDLDTGRQPMTTTDGSVVISQNGEIYDYVELREELLRRGHRLSTTGDTEVIGHLYQEFGDDFVDHLRGMFAVALWDKSRQRLILARDRLGKKPIYWRYADGRLTYGSEFKVILTEPDAPKDIDRQALALFLQYQYIPAPWTILRGVQKLPPASILTWDGGEPQVRRYWTPDYTQKVRRPLEEDRDAALELLRESVRLRLRSDVPVGAFLSGGMDSSTVVALMAEASSQVRTFSIGFKEKEYDELRYARAVAKHFGTDHVDEVVDLDAISLLPELAEHYDEPFGDPSAIPTFRVSQLAAKSLKVVLTGDGGDEAFGGYDRYRFEAAMSILGKLPTPLHMAGVSAAQAVLSRTAAKSKLRRRADNWRRLAALDSDTRYTRLMSIYQPPLRTALLRDAAAGYQDQYLETALRSGPKDKLDRLLRADMLTYLPEDLNVKVDRATMANSLEARSPLLDHRVYEFAARLPSDRKMHRGKSKIVLRAVAKQLMPAELVDRPKMGFGVPIGTWFRSSLGDVFSDTVLGPDSRTRDELDVTVARQILAEHRSGTADHGHRLWLLLMYELWARRWMGPAAALAETA